MSTKTPTGPELNAWRQRLGLTHGGVAAFFSVSWITARTINEWEERGVAASWRALYAEALEAEEERQLAGSPAAPKVGDWVRVRQSGTVYQVVEIVTAAGLLYYRKANGSAANSWTAEELEIVDPPEEERRASAEPVPPEGVTVRTVGRVDHISIDRGCGSDLFATVWHGDTCVSLEDEFATPEALEYVAALSRYRAAQHEAGEQQRLLDAVTAAEDAMDKARRAEDEAASERCIADNNWEIAKRALMDACAALDAARKAAGL